MKAKMFFIAALPLAHVCSAQTPTSSGTPSSWQLAPPFQINLDSPSPSPANSPIPTANRAASVVQTPPPRSAPPVSTPPQTIPASKSGNVSDSEGPVWVMTFVKTKSGSSDEYLKSIAGLLKPIFDEEKRQKIILDYKILSANAAGDRDFNVIIMAQYPNTAALNGLRERTEPIVDLIIGPADKRRDLAAKRLDIREILATKTMREITLK